MKVFYSILIAVGIVCFIIGFLFLFGFLCFNYPKILMLTYIILACFFIFHGIFKGVYTLINKD